MLFFKKNKGINLRHLFADKINHPWLKTRWPPRGMLSVDFTISEKVLWKEISVMDVFTVEKVKEGIYDLYMMKKLILDG